MNSFAKMDVALEILADKMSKVTMRFYETGKQEYQSEINNLMEERNKLYNGDNETIDKVINIYGEELKNENDGTRFNM